MVEFGDDLTISIALVCSLLVISMAKDLLDSGGLAAALAVGLVISLLGHWTWLLVLMTFLIVGSMATKWRFEEKVKISAEEANDGVRGWKNVLANGGMSPTGTLAAFYGALLISVVSTVLGAINGDQTPTVFFFSFVILFGWLGCQVDSILGALLENRGVLGKHSVNFLSTLSGSLMAIFVASRFL